MLNFDLLIRYDEHGQCFYQNVRSLKNKLATLRSCCVLLAEFDILNMTETWLTDHVDDSEIRSSLPSHFIFRRDRGTLRGTGGGVLSLIRCSLVPKRRHDLEGNCECLVTQLGLPGRSLLNAVFYRAPSDSDAAGEIVNVIDMLHQTGLPLLIQGDFNLPEISWSEKGPVVVGGQLSLTANLLDAFEQANCNQLIMNPTGSHNTFLDLALSNVPAARSELYQNTFESDHHAVWTSLPLQLVRPTPVNRCNAFNYKRADWCGLRQRIHLYPWSILSSLGAEEATGMFHDVLTAAIRDCIPVVYFSRKYPRWFDREIKEAIKLRERTRKYYKRCGGPMAYQLYSEKRRQLKQMLSHKYKDYLVNMVDSFHDNPKRFFSFVRVLGEKVGGGCIPPLTYKGVTAECDSAKADLLNRCFADKFSEKSSGLLPHVSGSNIDTLSSVTISEHEVRQHLRGINPHKACGPDGISGRIIGECSEELTVPLTILFNACLSDSLFPQIWKEANIIAIPKKAIRNWQ